MSARHIRVPLCFPSSISTGFHRRRIGNPYQGGRSQCLQHLTDSQTKSHNLPLADSWARIYPEPPNHITEIHTPCVYAVPTPVNQWGQTPLILSRSINYNRSTAGCPYFLLPQQHHPLVERRRTVTAPSLQFFLRNFITRQWCPIRHFIQNILKGRAIRFFSPLLQIALCWKSRNFFLFPLQNIFIFKRQ